MRGSTPLLVTALTFACSVVIAAQNEETKGNEKTWSIGVAKRGIEMKEVQAVADSTNSATDSAGQTKSTAGQNDRRLEDDPRWSVARPMCRDGDIDVAYVRLKKEFGYKTPDERLASTSGASGDLELIKRREGFEYVAQEGVYYLMRDRNRRTGDRVIQTELSKAGNNRYCLEFAFVNVGLSNPASYASQLQARYLATLQ